MITSPAHDYGVWLSLNSHTHLEIYNENVRGLRTKASEILANVYSSKFHVICLTETWLNNSCFNCILPWRIPTLWSR